MKYKVYITSLLFIFIITFQVFAKESFEDYETLRTHMLERGYIEFNPNPIYINDVFEEVAKEILGDMLPENHETTHFILSPLDGLSYSFYFVKELPDLPNIVVAVYKNGKGFYKINYDLEGEIKYFRDNTTGEEFEILLFD